MSMFFCVVCQDSKPLKDGALFPCQHQICNECFYHLVKVKCDDVYNDSALFNCPICRGMFNITFDLCHMYKIPASSFVADNVILPEHAKIIYGDKLSEFKQKRFGRGTDYDYQRLSEEQNVNIKRAVIQNNHSLISWWLTEGNDYGLDVLTIRNAWRSLSYTEHVLSDLTLKLLEHMVQHEGVDNNMHNLLLQQIIKMTEDQRSIEKIKTFLQILVPVLQKWKLSLIQSLLLHLSTLKELELLTWWSSANLPVMVSADIYGLTDLNVLKWWNKADAYFTEKLPMDAIRTTCLETLTWWKDHCSVFRFGDKAIKQAMRTQNIDTLNWWSEFYGSKLFATTEHAILALQINNLEILKWVLSQNKDEHCFKTSLTILLLYICEHGNLEMMQYLIKTYEEETRSLLQDVVARASYFNQIHLLNWLSSHCAKENNIILQCNHKLIDLAFKNNNKNIIEWWINWTREHNIQFYISEKAVNDALGQGHFELIEWWQDESKRINVPLTYTSDMFTDAISKRELKQWLKSDRCQLNLNFLIILEDEDEMENKQDGLSTMLRLCFS